MLIKDIPEDFVVREIPSFRPSSGEYAYFLLWKRGWTTTDAIRLIADRFHLPPKSFGYAGLKDKLAVTEQYLSVYKAGTSLASFSHPDIRLTYLGQGRERISLGDLKGNSFRIVVRKLRRKKILRLRPLKNYFDAQRFGIDRLNVRVGRALLKRNFKDACALLQLQPSGNDFIGCLRTLGTKMLLFYVHAYQSFLFNQFLDVYSGRAKDIPLVGYLTELPSSFRSLYGKLLRKEHVAPSDFLFREIPEISSEGALRPHFLTVSDFSYQYDNDDRCPGMLKCILSFSLDPGSYGTFVVRSLFPQSL